MRFFLFLGMNLTISAKGEVEDPAEILLNTILFPFDEGQAYMTKWYKQVLPSDKQVIGFGGGYDCYFTDCVKALEGIGHNFWILLDFIWWR